jgi:hydroxymethylpyrimidine/phosphomethylpyrimidine kinase / thiaminase
MIPVNGKINGFLIFRATQSSPFPFTKALIENTFSDWKDYVEHNFVVELGTGILSEDKFKHFMK